MREFKYIILGGGTTAGYAAKEFAERGIDKGELCIVSAESILPMDRPPLSKDYLKGEMKVTEDVEINESNFYYEKGIEVLLETCAKKVDFEKKTLELDNGDTVGYDKLLIATGSTLKHLSVEGQDLDNVFYLRNIKQSDKIREAVKNNTKAVVVGGAFIGTEVAAGLNALGAQVTMVYPESRLLARFANDVISGFFESYFKEKGVNLLKNNKVKKLIGNGKVNSVAVSSGQSLPANMVVAGVGVKPNIALFKDTALEMNYGIAVNEYCETSVKDVYAAGDVTEFPDKIFNKTRHVEHWENAMEQGTHAAGVMMGERKPYVFVPYFFSDLFDLSYEFFGDNTEFDDLIYRGDTKKGDFSAWWLKDGKLMAAFIMGSRPDEEREKARQWIKERTTVDIH